MKKIILTIFNRKCALLCFLFIFHSSLSFGQSWLWAKQGIAEEGLIDEGNGLTLDKRGNVYLTGSFQDTIQFGSYSLQFPSWESNVFIAKYDPNGNVLWARQSNCSAGLGYGYSVATDTSGNVYVAGIFVDTLIFNPYKLISNGLSYCGFLTKYDVNGDVVWARESIQNATSEARVYFVASTPSGGVIITGSYTNTTVFGMDTLRNSGIFVVRYDANGNVIWAKQGTGGNYGYSIASDNQNNIYVTGDYTNSVTFGAITLSASGSNVFLVKYDSNGNVIWAKTSSNPGSYTAGIGVCTDDHNHIYLTGGFISSITFGSYQLSSGVGDVFLTKYDTAGNVLWAIQGTVLDSSDWSGTSVSTDNLGHVYLSGGKQFGNRDEIAFNNDTLSAYRAYETDPSILIEFDTAGNFICGSIIASGGDDNNVVVSDSSGKYVYLGSDLEDTVTFGPDRIGPSNNGTEWPFVARWQPCKGGGGGEGISPIKNTETMAVYPNPFTNFTTVVVNTEGKHYLEVDDLTGRKLQSVQFTGKSYQLSVVSSQLAPGMYFIRVFDSQNALIGTSKIIVE